VPWPTNAPQGKQRAGHGGRGVLQPSRQSSVSGCLQHKPTALPPPCSSALERRRRYAKVRSVPISAARIRQKQTVRLAAASRGTGLPLPTHCRRARRTGRARSIDPKRPPTIDESGRRVNAECRPHCRRTQHLHVGQLRKQRPAANSSELPESDLWAGRRRAPLPATRRAYRTNQVSGSPPGS
jgi:hypothetical protein